MARINFLASMTKIIVAIHQYKFSQYIKLRQETFQVIKSRRISTIHCQATIYIETL